MAEKLALGFDLSTQSLSCLVATYDGAVVFEDSVNFDAELPHFHTRNGMHVRGNEVTAPPLMWLEAMDIALRRVSEALGEAQMQRIVCLSASAQQHGSVFWDREAMVKMNTQMNAASKHKPLQELLGSCFAVEASPIWADSSTQMQCDELERIAGGAQQLADLTGSRAFHRFTAAQIMKIVQEKAQEFEDTCHISLVSAFVTSVMLGEFAPIDASDASGMNLMDIQTKSWATEICNAIHPRLVSMFPPIVDPWTNLGKISSYHVARYGFSKDCAVIVGTGDNPSTLAGLGIHTNQEGTGPVMGACVSLGTSDTFLGVAQRPTPKQLGHVMVHPTNPQHYFVMLCYKNGAASREQVNRQFCDGDWERFSNSISASNPGSDGFLNATFPLPEIAPDIPEPCTYYERHGVACESIPGELQARSVIEQRFLAMRFHAQQLGISSLSSIVATGGASVNHEILQVLADVFQCDVSTISTPNAAVRGAAARAIYGLESSASFDEPASESFASIIDQLGLQRTSKVVCTPNHANKQLYDDNIEQYAQFELRLKQHIHQRMKKRNSSTVPQQALLLAKGAVNSLVETATDHRNLMIAATAGAAILSVALLGVLRARQR